MDSNIVRSQEQETPETLLDELIPRDKPELHYILMALALLLALISFFLVAPWAGSPETYAPIINSLDSKRETVMNLVAGSTGTSAAITLLPGDVGTPIAEQLLELGSGFAFILGALYLEKYLLTVIGLAVFKIVVPVGCVLFALGLLAKEKVLLRSALLGISARLVLFGLAVVLAVPASVFISDQIEATYEASVAQTVELAVQTQEELGQTTGEESSGGLIGVIQHIPETISETASGVSKETQALVNSFVETLAVMVVTSCILPLLVLIFFLWLAKTLLGLQLPASFIERNKKGLPSLRRY